ncbi:AfsA-related hotdog domain-containing protein [Xenorhabdus stockiae]|uniref:AfsA-related hotdog domain-containing protein n=1 Tax=Xenorhabdus stockiae TaxID=351614 RepID=UPI0040642918
MKIIIGDKFISFINATGNISYSEVANNPDLFHGGSFIVGLGLSHEEISTLNKISKDYHFTLYHPVLPAVPADCSVTHKNKTENCLITKPVQITEDLYESQLIIDDESELLLDHITGLHLQGMILTEVCRQMFIAVAMDYFSHNYFSDERYGAINTMNCKFESYAFPLPAVVRYTRKEIIKNVERENIAFSAEIEILQSGRRIFLMDMKHTYYKNEKIKPIELYKARSACQRLTENTLLGETNDETSREIRLL